MSLSLEQLVNLQVRGVSADTIEPGRRGGAGPSDSRAFLLDGRCVLLNVVNRPDAYDVEHHENGCCLHGQDGENISSSLVRKAKFYDLKTADGIPYKKIALLHGNNCLASTVLQTCLRYARPETRCRFCALGRSLKAGATIAKKTPEQLAEVAEAAKRLDGVTHVTLTSGTAVNRDEGILYLGKCAQAITERTGLPVQLQFEPPVDLGVFEKLKEFGVANVAMHVESLDESVRRRMTPGKAEISLVRYFEAFKKAVEVFGRNRVGTYVILGLGENRDITRCLIDRLCEIGVYPNLVPLHPLEGTTFEGAGELDPAYLLDMYTFTGRCLRRTGLTRAGNVAGCGCCGACSLLQFTEKEGVVGHIDRRKKLADRLSRVDSSECDISLNIAETPEDLAECHAIRREVFCQEQGLFNGVDDTDERDPYAVHILARVNGEAAGVVRCFRRSEGVWVGGRLAVRKKYRSHLGALLVRRAVSTMEERGDVRRFFAVVQIQNLHFFEFLQWKPLGIPFLCHGVLHQVMEKPLGTGE